MNRTKAKTRINSEQSLQLTSITGLHDLSEAESQTIQGGAILLLLPAVQSAREAAR